MFGSHLFTHAVLLLFARCCLLTMVEPFLIVYYTIRMFRAIALVLLATLAHGEHLRKLSPLNQKTQNSHQDKNHQEERRRRLIDVTSLDQTCALCNFDGLTVYPASALNGKVADGTVKGAALHSGCGMNVAPYDTTASFITVC
jgi:hypothetical protein